ncbi:MAG: CaiB/BaiF CoA-transferase family protein [Bacteroidota bacterium]
MGTSEIFKDLKIIELASVLAGPAVGLFFAELGAEVIKIENQGTGGDTTRHWKLPQEDQKAPYSAYFHSVNWGKQHHFLNLKEQEDYQQLLALVAEADIVISNYKAGSAQKLGVDYESLRQHNPQLIYGRISAYGDDDPRPGFDVLIQAETAWLSMNGEAGGPPVKLPVALMDIMAAHQLKEGLLVALLQRYKTGKGSQVAVALFDAGVASLANQATNWLNVGHNPQRMGSQHPNIAPYGDIHYSQEGKPVILSTGTEKQYLALLDCLELSELKADPRFTSNALRLKHRAELNKHLAAAFAQLPLATLLDRCAAQGVPLAPIRDMKALFELPEAQRLVMEETLPDGYLSKRVKTAVFKLKPGG